MPTCGCWESNLGCQLLSHSPQPVSPLAYAFMSSCFSTSSGLPQPSVPSWAQKVKLSKLLSCANGTPLCLSCSNGTPLLYFHLPRLAYGGSHPPLAPQLLYPTLADCYCHVSKLSISSQIRLIFISYFIYFVFCVVFVCVSCFS